MRTQLWYIPVTLFCIPLFLLAKAQQPPATDLREYSFIEPGKDYHIYFPDDRNPFMFALTETAESYQRSPDGGKTDLQNIPVTLTIRSDIFRVVQLHGESWVLVEHPASANDYAAWSGKHYAAFLLKQKANLSADQLASVNEAATREIKDIQTWINLSHAVTVKPVSAESLGVSK